MERALYDKFQCHKLQEGDFSVQGYFWLSKDDSVQFQTQRNRIPCFRLDNPV